MVLIGLWLPAQACLVNETCFSDRDCIAPKRCSAGTCAYQCSKDSDCGKGFVCKSHRCVPDSSNDDLECPQDMVKVENAFCIDTYEASRPDATATDPGSDGSKAVSRKGAIPWRVGDNATAQAACAAAGKRLCTPSEWEAACRGAKGTEYAYGDVYEPKTCNGTDTFGNDFHLSPTGTFPKCTNSYGVYDMNGNIWEHVLGGSGKTVRGGAYNCGDSAAFHKCSYIPQRWTPSALGFRCCLSKTAPEVTAPDGGLEGPPTPEPVGDASVPEPTFERLQDAGPGETRPERVVEADGGPSLDGRPPVQPCPKEMALIEGRFCMDLYEASRPDATDTDEGTDSSKATSRVKVLPWQVPDNKTAAGACAAAGKRLCKPDEWKTGCQSGKKTVYCYGDKYEPKTCNGIDAFGTDKFHLEPTGSMPNCKNSWGVYDLNGNVWEHVAGGDSTTVRGGAYNCGDSETFHKCDYIPGWSPSALGFRCCKDRVGAGPGERATSDGKSGDGAGVGDGGGSGDAGP